MSNHAAIAAATATLRALLEKVAQDAHELDGLTVTTEPLDKFADDETDKPRLNLFLFAVRHSPTWINMPIPGQARPAEAAPPPLGLELHYLITADGTADGNAHRALGSAMSTFHDHPVLGRKEIADAQANSELENQIERLRISPLTQSVDDISKLWAAFQTPYRLSTAYEVSVVLIDSARPRRQVLPVLRQGKLDQGPYVVAALPPQVDEIRYQPGRQAARLGDVVTLVGRGFGGGAARLRLMRSDPVQATTTAPDPPADLVIELPIRAGDAPGEALVTTPAPTSPGEMAKLAAGVYAARIVMDSGTPVEMTGPEFVFSLAPTIQIDQATIGPVVTIKLSCSPPIRAGQKVSLLFAGQQQSASDAGVLSQNGLATVLEFKFSDVKSGRHPVRLRVDGVDSIPVTMTGAFPEFDQVQTVQV